MRCFTPQPVGSQRSKHGLFYKKTLLVFLQDRTRRLSRHELDAHGQCLVVCRCLCRVVKWWLKQLKLILVFVCCPGWNNDPLILLPLHLHCPVKLNKKISWPIHPTARQLLKVQVWFSFHQTKRLMSCVPTFLNNLLRHHLGYWTAPFHTAHTCYSRSEFDFQQCGRADVVNHTQLGFP